LAEKKETGRSKGVIGVKTGRRGKDTGEEERKCDVTQKMHEWGGTCTGSFRTSFKPGGKKTIEDRACGMTITKAGHQAAQTQSDKRKKKTR